MFITGRVAITVDGVTDEKDLTDLSNVVFIRPKMDYGTRNKVVGEAARLIQQAATAKSPTGKVASTKAGGSRRGKAVKGDMQFDLGAYQTALLVHNILGWSGPGFRGFACTPANIAMMDPDEPLLKVVVSEITDRNASEDESEPAAELDDPNVIEMATT